MDPVFLFVHLPRSGGNSLNAVLDAWFPDKVLRHYTAKHQDCLTETEMDELVQTHPEKTVFCAHAFRHYPALVGGRPAFYFTLLRDPVQYVLSNLSFIKKHPKNFERLYGEAAIRRIPDMTLREIFAYNQGRFPASRRGNNIVRFYSAFSLSRRFDDAEAALQAYGLAHCITLLERFFFIGSTEQFDSDIERLRQRFALFGADLPVLDTPHNNSSREHRGGDDWIHDRDEMGAKLLSLTEKDRALYEHFLGPIRGLSDHMDAIKLGL